MKCTTFIYKFLPVSNILYSLHFSNLCELAPFKERATFSQCCPRVAQFPCEWNSSDCYCTFFQFVLSFCQLMKKKVAKANQYLHLKKRYFSFGRYAEIVDCYQFRTSVMVKANTSKMYLLGNASYWIREF